MSQRQAQETNNHISQTKLKSKETTSLHSQLLTVPMGGPPSFADHERSETQPIHCESYR